MIAMQKTQNSFSFEDATLVQRSAGAELYWVKTERDLAILAQSRRAIFRRTCPAMLGAEELVPQTAMGFALVRDGRIIAGATVHLNEVNRLIVSNVFVDAGHAGFAEVMQLGRAIRDLATRMEVDDLAFQAPALAGRLISAATRRLSGEMRRTVRHAPSTVLAGL